MLQRLAYRHDYDTPALVFNLLSARLNNLFEPFDDGTFVSIVATLQLVGERHEDRILPRTVLPRFITTAATSLPTPLRF